jgi:hypothetical protein
VRDAVVNNTLFVPHAVSGALHAAPQPALPRAADDAPPSDGGGSGAEDDGRGREPQSDTRCDPRATGGRRGGETRRAP